MEIKRIYDFDREIEDMSNDKVQVTFTYEEYEQLHELIQAIAWNDCNNLTMAKASKMLQKIRKAEK